MITEDAALFDFPRSYCINLTTQLEGKQIYKRLNLKKNIKAERKTDMQFSKLSKLLWDVL